MFGEDFFSSLTQYEEEERPKKPNSPPHNRHEWLQNHKFKEWPETPSHDLESIGPAGILGELEDIRQDLIDNARMFVAMDVFSLFTVSSIDIICFPKLTFVSLVCLAISFFNKLFVLVIHSEESLHILGWDNAILDNVDSHLKTLEDKLSELSQRFLCEDENGAESCDETCGIRIIREKGEQ